MPIGIGFLFLQTAFNEAPGALPKYRPAGI